MNRTSSGGQGRHIIDKAVPPIVPGSFHYFHLSRWRLVRPKVAPCTGPSAIREWTLASAILARARARATQTVDRRTLT